MQDTEYIDTPERPSPPGKAVFRPEVLLSVPRIVESLKTPLLGQNYINRALQAPSRAVGGGSSNLHGRFPSLRMGATIQFESGTLELPTIHKFERDRLVRMYCDQPPKIKLAYPGQDGKKRSYLVTPDFLVMYDTRIVLVECKPVKVLQERSLSDPHLYKLTPNGWVCPPAQEAARELGFEHIVMTETSFTHAGVENLQILDDYYRGQLSDESRENMAEVARLVRERGAITIDQLLAAIKSRGMGIDDIYRSITHQAVTSDLDAAFLARPEAFWLYRDQTSLDAHKLSRSCIMQAANWESPNSVEFESGSKFLWEGLLHEVLVRNDEVLHLRREDKSVVQMSVPEMRAFLASGSVQPFKPLDRIGQAREMDGQEALASCSQEDLEKAIRRYQTLKPYLEGVATHPACRTKRRHLQRYRAATTAYGNGFLGLIPLTRLSGNREKRLMQEVLDLAAEKLKEFMDYRRLNVKRVYQSLKLGCDEKGLPAPSYAWFCRLVKSQNQYKVKLSREGSKAAYNLSPRAGEDPDVALNAAPVYPMQRAHVDHTLIDVETVFPDTFESLGRAWLTVMTDHVGRNILGMYLTYCPPSYRSVLMVMRDCVRRNGRLPSSIVVDGGKEFRSIWFEVACAYFSVVVIRRPPRKSRNGSQVGRTFKTFDSQFFHALEGNTQNMKNVRQSSGEVAAEKHAVWDFERLYARLEEFCFEVYDQMPHAGLLMSPRKFKELAKKKYGTRSERYIRYDDNFLMMTAPSTPKGTAKVQPDGVKINNFYYTWSGVGEHLGKSLPVRYDPFNASRALVQVEGKWIVAHSRFQSQLRGMTEQQIKFYTEEYRRRTGITQAASLNETSLAKFLLSVREEEKFLLEEKRAFLERLRRGDEVPSTTAALTSPVKPAATDRSDHSDLPEEVLSRSEDDDFDFQPLNLETYQ